MMEFLCPTLELMILLPGILLDSLRTAIAETREARHDMCHHFNILQNLAVQKEWERLEKYLAERRKAYRMRRC